MTFCTKKLRKTNNINDKIYTPEYLVKKIMEELPIKDTDTLFDAFKGKGVFYNNYPEKNTKYWCEIDEGFDFYNFDKNVDWIITNPPYSDFTRVMEHSYKIANNIVYLIPLNKIWSSWGRTLDLYKYGGIKKLWIFPAKKANFPFGFPACFVWIQRGYVGDIQTELWDNL